MRQSGSRKRQSRKRGVSESIDAQALQVLLEQHLQSLPFAISEGAVGRFVQFIQLLHKWNNAYNLTSVRDMRLMVTRHILDSVVIQPYLRGTRILDVGSGAGLPGIPLAILNPQLEFTLLDSNNKKTRFIQQAVTELGLANVTVVCDRVEHYHDSQAFDTVTARAYSAIAKMLEGIRHLINPDAVILAMKGIYPVAELEEIASGFRVEGVEQLQVPGLDAERHLVIIRPSAPA